MINGGEARLPLREICYLEACATQKKKGIVSPRENGVVCPPLSGGGGGGDSLGNELATHVDERCINVADVRIQCFLDHACLHKCGARDSGTVLCREALIPEAHGAVPQKHAAAIQRPHRILPRLRGCRGVFSALVVLPRKEQLELNFLLDGVFVIPSSRIMCAHWKSRSERGRVVRAARLPARQYGSRQARAHSSTSGASPPP